MAIERKIPAKKPAAAKPAAKKPAGTAAKKKVVTVGGTKVGVITKKARVSGAEKLKNKAEYKKTRAKTLAAAKKERAHRTPKEKLQAGKEAAIRRAVKAGKDPKKAAAEYVARAKKTGGSKPAAGAKSASLAAFRAARAKAHQDHLAKVATIKKIADPAKRAAAMKMHREKHAASRAALRAKHGLKPMAEKKAAAKPAVKKAAAKPAVKKAAVKKAAAKPAAKPAVKKAATGIKRTTPKRLGA